MLCCAHRLFASSRDIVPTHRLLYGGRQVNAPARTGEDAVLTPLATADVWPFAGLRQGGTPCSGEVNSCKCALTARRTPRRHAPARAPAGRAGGARAAAGRRDTRALSDLLRAARPRAAAERVAHPGRSDRAADDRGDAAVQAHLPGPGAARARARDHHPKVHPHERHRERRRYRAPPHVLRGAPHGLPTWALCRSGSSVLKSRPAVLCGPGRSRGRSAGRRP